MIWLSGIFLQQSCSFLVTVDSQPDCFTTALTAAIGCPITLSSTLNKLYLLSITSLDFYELATPLLNVLSVDFAVKILGELIAKESVLMLKWIQFTHKKVKRNMCVCVCVYQQYHVG